MPDIAQGDSIAGGGIDLGRAFVTFTRHTEQKITHGLLFETLLHALKGRGVVLKDDRPTELVDLGCGEGRTACEMIDAINRAHPEGDGVNYHGLDADDRFVSSTRRWLSVARDRLRLRVIDVRHADVLSGKPLPIGSIDDVLVTMGHVLYYAGSLEGPDETHARISGIVDRVVSVLGRDGLCLLFHSAQDCPLATLRASVADSVEAKPARIVAEVAAEKRLVLMSLIAPYRIFFPPLMPTQWEKTKDPSCYSAESSSDRRFADALELLTFVAQRGLKGLGEGGHLGRFVDDLRSHLDGDSVFHALANYQFLLSPRRSAHFEEGVEAARRRCERSLDQIVREAGRTFVLDADTLSRGDQPGR